MDLVTILPTHFIPYMHDCHKSGPKSDFFKESNFLSNQLDVVVFWFFTRMNKVKMEPLNGHQ